MACLGGSTTWEGTYPETLERLLNASSQQGGAAGPIYEVLNFGAEAWTSAEIMINYVVRGQHADPDCLVFYEAVNDVVAASHLRGVQPEPDYSHWRTRMKPPPSPAWMSFVPLTLDNLACVRVLRYLDYRRQAVDAWLTAMRRYEFRGDQEFQGTETFRRNVESLVAVALARGSMVFLVTQIHSPEWSRKICGNENGIGRAAAMNETLREISRKHQATGKVFLIDAAAEAERLGLYGAMHDWCHFSPAGYAVLAKLIAAERPPPSAARARLPATVAVLREVFFGRLDDGHLMALPAAVVEGEASTVGLVFGRMEKTAPRPPLALDQDEFVVDDLEHDAGMGDDARFVPINDQVSLGRRLDRTVAVVFQDALDIVGMDGVAAARENPPVAIARRIDRAGSDDVALQLLLGDPAPLGLFRLGTQDESVELEPAPAIGQHPNAGNLVSTEDDGLEPSKFLGRFRPFAGGEGRVQRTADQHEDPNQPRLDQSPGETHETDGVGRPSHQRQNPKNGQRPPNVGWPLGKTQACGPDTKHQARQGRGHPDIATAPIPLKQDAGQAENRAANPNAPHLEQQSGNTEVGHAPPLPAQPIGGPMSAPRTVSGSQRAEDLSAHSP